MYKHILFIEDETDIAEIYAQTLTSNGYDVVCSYDGEAGLKEALTGKYDLILLDLMLPFKSGMDVLKTLRDRSLSPSFDQNTDIFILTNFDEDDITKQEIMKLSQAYFIKVNITPRILAGILQDMDSKSQATTPPAPVPA